MGALEAFTIILSAVSTIISVLAFFASLKFYRDGIELQQSANSALTKIEEKTAFIQTQVGGMFDKTLEAAIGKKEILSDQFEQVNEQVETATKKLIEQSIGQIGAAGEKEREQLKALVESQMALIREKLDTTRESAEEIIENKDSPLLRTTPTFILSLIKKNKGLSHDALHSALRRRNASTQWLKPQLNRLVQDGLVTKVDDTYYAVTNDE